MKDATSGVPRWMPRVSGLAAALAALVLLVGIAGLATGTPAVRPWLAVLFGIDAGMGGVSLGSLGGIDPIDVVVLVLAGVAFAGFWPGPGKPHKPWMGLAILLPFAGIGVLVATGLWGRSGLMGGGLVLSLLMLGNPGFKRLGYLGIAANLLLLAGDFATTGRSVLVAGVVALGYVLMIAWLAWIAAGVNGLLVSSGAASHA